MITSILTSAVTNFTVVLILMLADLVTGVAKSLQAHSIKSAKLRNSLNKMVIYFFVLIIGGCLSVAGETGVAGIFVVFLCIVEGVSILENLGEMFPNLPIIKKLSKFLESKAENKVKTADD